ncbi:MAG: hypothetical protein IT429_03735 [Gemmataceae bacterium]|nr:hypothetical protein [Gemmataceae bacterium]
MDGPYAAPRTVTDLADCYFYHTMQIPEHGLVEGEWDLRAGVDAYLGGIPLRGRRVLEVGTASGFLCFSMEQRGADVVAFDLAPDQAPDLIPSAADPGQRLAAHREHMRRLTNGYWLCHRAFGSRARVAHGSAYAVSDAIGPVDVATFGCVLLHLRDPFLALSSALRLTREAVVVTEPVVIRSRLKRWLLRALAGPALLFFPRAGGAGPETTWWILTPEVVQTFLGLLGFGKTRVSYHEQRYRGRPVKLFTVVGERTDEQGET